MSTNLGPVDRREQVRISQQPSIERGEAEPFAAMPFDRQGSMHVGKQR